MEVKSWIFIRVLLNRFHQAASEAALRCLPREEIQGIQSQDVKLDNPGLALVQPQELIQRMHYSWLVPALKTIPKSLQLLILEALPQRYAAKLKGMLKMKSMPSPGKAMAPPVQTFLINTLYTHLPPPDILPLAVLPQTSLSPLAEWRKDQLVTLIDLLGLYDLAEEMKKIIDQKRLKQLLACLPAQKKAFLRTCLHQKEKIATTGLALEKWNGSCQSLEEMLHRRGILRFGKSLCGQHPDLVWYLVHILDVGRGKLVGKYYSPAVTPGITPVLVQQVLNIMNFLETKSPA